jgi:hypothetical protein
MGITFIVTALLYNPPPRPDMLKFTFTEKLAKLE